MDNMLGTLQANASEESSASPLAINLPLHWPEKSSTMVEKDLLAGSDSPGRELALNIVGPEGSR